MILQELIVPLILDSSKFDSGIDKAISKGRNLMKGLSMIGGGVLAAGFTAVTGAAILLGKTVSPGSNLAESINALNVVFTDASGILHEYGKTSAQTVGLSTRAFNQLSSVTGAFLTNLGFTSEGAAKETIKLTERAADMASVFNTDVSVALEAIQSGLKGEFNPLEQFGVKLNAAAIETRALEMGLAGTASELTDSQKATAALALIYEQTNKVAGDFRNTSDGVANQSKIIKAQFENMAAMFGTKLLPAISKAGKFLLDYFGKPETQQFIEGLATSIGNLAMKAVDQLPIFAANIEKAFTWLMNNKGVLVGVFAALGVAILAFGVTVATAAWTALSPLLPVIAVMALVGVAAYLLYQAWTTNFGGIQDKARAVWAFLQPIFNNIKTWLQNNIPVAIQVLSGKWIMLVTTVQTAWNILKTIANFIGTTFNNAFTRISNAISSVVGWVNRLRSALSGLSIPSWLTPGSPTPFENGLVGINNAMQNLNRNALPQFSANLNINSNPLNGNQSQGNPIDYKRLAREIVTATVRATGG